jgi:periplasmic protein TonB
MKSRPVPEGNQWQRHPSTTCNKRDALMTAIIVDMDLGPKGWTSNRANACTLRIEAGMLSVLLHIAFLCLGFLMIRPVEKPLVTREALIFLNRPFFFPSDDDGMPGGGGGGKGELGPATTGRLPALFRQRGILDDLEAPIPLLAVDNQPAFIAGVQIPPEIVQDESLPVGDITAPPNSVVSSGPGTGGGFGPGYGPGVGQGKGPGVGPGSKGGWGGGPGGGPGTVDQPFLAGNGVIPPVPLSQPLPNYTDQARKARIEGLMLLQAIVRKDGSVDSIRIVRGLGYGLDESAIGMISRKWRFRPGTLHGMPVDVVATIEVNFRLF